MATYTRTNLVATTGAISSGSLPAFSNTVNAGDLIVVAAVTALATIGTIAFSDNKTGAVYVQQLDITWTSATYGGAMWSGVASASGVPTITPSTYGAQGVRAVAASYTGFVGTPTFLSNDQGYGLGSGTGASSSPFTTANISELAIGTLGASTGTSNVFFGSVFGDYLTNTDDYLYYADSIGNYSGGLPGAAVVQLTNTVNSGGGWSTLTMGASFVPGVARGGARMYVLP